MDLKLQFSVSKFALSFNMVKGLFLLLLGVAGLNSLAAQEDPTVCADLVDGYHPDPVNCRQYWHCFEHKLEAEFTCPTGQS